MTIFLLDGTVTVRRGIRMQGESAGSDQGTIRGLRVQCYHDLMAARHWPCWGQAE
jgi:hypothetical protein